ncbi:MFS general substrate transporter, partial [Exidia glandulosa HHB12029]
VSQTIVTNAIPRIASVFNALDEITWIPTAFLLTQAPFLLVYGQLNTLFPAKWVFLIAMIIFEIGSLLSGVATSIEFLIFARAFQGVGAAGIFVGIMTMLADILPLQERPKYFGLFGGVFALSGILGPLIGGAFVDHVSWRWCFYINLPLAVPTFWFSLQFLPSKPAQIDRVSGPPPPKEGQSKRAAVTHRFFTRMAKLDWVAVVFSLGATTSLVLALQWGGIEKPWSSADVIATLCVAAVVACLFVAWEWYKGDSALVPLRLFRNRTLIGSSLASCFTRMAFFIAVYELPLYFQAVKGHSPTKSGLDLIPITLSVVITGGFIGFLISKFGRYWHFIILGPIVGAVGFGLVFTLDENSSWGRIIGYQILMGISIGCNLQTPLLAVQADMAKEDIAQATSVVTFSQFLGGIIALAIAGYVARSKLVSGLHEFAPDAPVDLLRKSVSALGQLPADQRAGALHAYVKALQWCLGPLGVTASVLTSLSGLIIRNVSVRKPEDRPESKANSGVATPEGRGSDLELQTSRS